MDLSVGMYVRSKINGIIGKITDIENIEASNGIEVIRAGIRYILDNNYNRGFCDTEKDSVIARHNIIDLIEVGDYVNGIRVGYINKGEDYLYALTDENTRDVICGYDSDGFTKPLHSIVTKQQFLQMEFKVGE